MFRYCIPLALALFGCTAEPPPQQEQAPPAAPSTPERPDSESTGTSATESPDDHALPPSIPFGASVTRQGPGDGPPITVSTGGGNVVAWSHSEVKLTPIPFDPSTVVARVSSADLWARTEREPGTVRVCYSLYGLPSDALFLELDSKASEVVWADDTRGTVREVSSQSSGDYGCSMDVLTTVPPNDPTIRSMHIALDLHRPTRVSRSEAAIGIDDSARFDFGIRRMEWVLSSDLQVTEFGAGQYRKPITPLLDRGLYASVLVQLADAKGVPLRPGGGGGAGSQTIKTWWGGSDDPLAPPVHVTVDVPQETVTTRVVVSLKDIRPTR